MRHVALFHDTVVSCWPLKAAEEYKKKFGSGAFNKNEAGREAVFLGEWLYSHMNDFKIVDTEKEVDLDSDDVYQIRKDNCFAWGEKYDVCKAKVVEVLDDEKWGIDYTDNDCREILVVYGEPDEYGYTPTVRFMGWN